MLRFASVAVVVALAGCGSSSGSSRSAGTGGSSSSSAADHVLKPYRVPSESMMPTLAVGQTVTVDLQAYESSAPKRGDVVVFHPPAAANGEVPGKGPGGQCGVGYGAGRACPVAGKQESAVPFLKRVVAVGGDTIAIRDGHVILNGTLQHESFIAPCHSGDECNFPTPITLPANTYFVLGDNRGQSDDSRFWGPVPQAWIIGKVITND